MKSRLKCHSILAFGIALLLVSSIVACSQGSTTSDTTPPSEPEAEEPEELPPSEPEAEEPEESPVSINALAWELKHGILLDDLADFLSEYPVVRFQPEDEPQAEKIWMHEFHFGGGGNYYMRSRMVAENVYQAKIHVENANSLLTDHKLPTEVAARPLDKGEVAGELEEAKSLLMAQQSASSSAEEEAIEWAEQPHGSDISNEQTITDIINTHDDYRKKLSNIITKIDHILSELPKATED